MCLEIGHNIEILVSKCHSGPSRDSHDRAVKGVTGAKPPVKASATTSFRGLENEENTFLEKLV